MNVSLAKELLQQATNEQDRRSKHLFVAAALGEVLRRRPIVVGGTAEDFYTGDVYRETDLDVVAWLPNATEEHLLEELGFHREPPRHWMHGASNVAVEFPDDRLAGDETRVNRVPVGGGTALVISVEDLYLDRLQQAVASLTPPKDDDLNVKAAIAVAIAQFESIDWKYIDGRIRHVERVNGREGEEMRRLHRRIRRKVLRAR